MKPSRLYAVSLMICMIISAVSAFTSPAKAGSMTGTEFDLIAGGGNSKSALDVGSVSVVNDGTALTVTYTIDTGDWQFHETHLHVATSIADIPQTRKNCPQPGRFAHSIPDIGEPTSQTYTISITDIFGGDTPPPGTYSLYIAAHAAIGYIDEMDPLNPDDDAVYEESAWGTDEQFPCRNWAMYIEYEISIPSPIAIEKHTNGQDADEPPGPNVIEGSTVIWTYMVTNTGSDLLSNITVIDDQGVAVLCPKNTLEPGESMTCTGSGTAQAMQYANLGVASGTLPSGGAVTDSDPSHYYGEHYDGCTPAYWKNHTTSWPPTGYTTGQTVESVFMSASSYPSLGNATLLEALSFSGGAGLEGAAEILLRAAVAALLNASHPGLTYPRTTAQVITEVNAALASGSRDTMLSLAASLDADNNVGCPLS